MKKLFIFLFIAFLFLQASADTFAPRYGHTMTNVDGVLYVFGGNAGESADAEIYDDLTILNPATGEFETIIPDNDGPTGRYGHNAVCHDGDLYILFGKTTESVSNEIWKYDPQTNTWEQISASGTSPQGRYHANAIYTDNDKIMIVSGLDTYDEGLSDSWLYDIAYNSWEQVEDYPGSCAGGGSFAYDGNSYVFGGYDTEFRSFRNDIWMYNFTLLTWVYINAMGTIPTERSFCAISFVLFMQFYPYFFIFGGNDASDAELSTNYMFDPSTEVWQQLSEGQYRSHSAAAMSSDNTVTILDGLNDENIPTGHVWNYNIDDDSWMNVVSIFSLPTQNENNLNRSPNPFSESVEINFGDATNVPQQISIYDINGRLVKIIETDQQNSISWDGREFSGAAVAKGSYFIVAEGYNSTKVIKR